LGRPCNTQREIYRLNKMKLTEREKELIVHAIHIVKKDYEDLLEYQPKFKTLKASIDMCNNIIKKIK